MKEMSISLISLIRVFFATFCVGIIIWIWDAKLASFFMFGAATASFFIRYFGLFKTEEEVEKCHKN